MTTQARTLPDLPPLDDAISECLSMLAAIDTHDVNLRDHPEAWKAMEAFAATALEAAQAEIARLREDAERLDWLADPDNAIGNVQLPTWAVEANIHSLRAAIDAARTGGKA